MIVTEKTINAVSVAVCIGEIMKIESLFGQLKPRNRIIFLLKILFQDSPVFSQNVVDAPHMLSRILIFTVVECVSAVIGTEFLIPTPSQYMTAL